MDTWILVAILLVGGLGLDNGVGLTPPMGWNSWNHFGCNINENLIKQTADLLVSSGLAAKGYVYLNLDDCWQISRDANTHVIQEDKTKFPSGMKALSDYVHSKGLKFGLYSDAGEKTCQGRPGGYSFEAVDAKTYASWEVDYLKYDNCYHPNVTAKVRYSAMRKALNESGRRIFYSICNWGEEMVPTWGSEYGNSWRTTGDISDNWNSFTHILDLQDGLQVYAGPGGWNDPDMLEVGNGGMSLNQYTAHFALWALLKAPLLLGNDLSKLNSNILNILGNEELIAISQDKLGVQGKRLKKEQSANGSREVWGGPLANDKFAVIFFNRGSNAVSMNASISDELKFQFGTYSVRDVIRHQQNGISDKKVLVVDSVLSHSVEVFVLTGISKFPDQPAIDRAIDLGKAEILLEIVQNIFEE